MIHLRVDSGLLKVCFRFFFASELHGTWRTTQNEENTDESMKLFVMGPRSNRQPLQKAETSPSSHRKRLSDILATNFAFLRRKVGVG